jgi:hypothetical protein
MVVWTIVCLAAAIGRAGEVVKATSGSAGNQASLEIQMTDETLTYYDAWDAWGAFEARGSTVDESHIGYRDLKHGVINSITHQPNSPLPPKYFRVQTIAEMWGLDYQPGAPADNTKSSGKLNLVVHRDDFGSDTTISGSWNTFSITSYSYGKETITANINSCSVASWRDNSFKVSAGTREDMFVYTDGRATDDSIIDLANQIRYIEAPGSMLLGVNSSPGSSYVTFFSQPRTWTETLAQWSAAGNDTGFLVALNSAQRDYTLELSDEDTLADVQSRWDADRGMVVPAGIPWTMHRYVQHKQADEYGERNDYLWLYNYHVDFPTYGTVYEENAELRFNVPQELRVPGVGYRGRVIEYFYPDSGGNAEVVKIHEVTMRDGHWISDVIHPVMRPEDGSTVLADFSAVAEVIQPHAVLAFPPPADALTPTVPTEYATTRPNLVAQNMVDTAGAVSRTVLVGSQTLQQINLGDTDGALDFWSDATATWSVLSDSTVQVRLWKWTDDGSPNGTWTVLPQGCDLRPYYGSRSDFIFAEALGGGYATLRFAITLNGQQINDDIVVTAQAVPAALAVDANRDGTIDLPPSSPSATYADATSPGAPFRFWINDDDDVGEEKIGPLDDLPLSAATSGRNCDDNQVNGIRDLVDFFPVCLDVKQLLTVLPPGTNGVSYYLKQEDSALGIVFTSYTRAQAFDYLRGTPSSLNTGFGPALAQKAGEATVTKITSAGVDLFATSPAFQAQIQNNDGGVILVEASKATTKPLVLEVRKGTDVIATVQLALKTDPVETMFHYYNIRSQAHGTAIAANNQGPNYGATTPSDAPNDPFQDVPNRKNAVFVHGYNVNSQQAQGSAAEMFKRLYWGGSKAKFYAVLWRGDDGQGEGPLVPAGATPDYHRNVGHAWQQGPYLRDLLTSLTGDTAVIAHSLGNMVTEVALTYERDPSNTARLRPAARPASVKNYFAIDAALPLEAVRGTAITTNSKALMRHPDWAEYDTQERLWPTQWYALFTGTSDGRSGLTWRNVFGGLDVGTNLYSSGEEVLANPINDSVPLWEPLFGGGLRAWVSQEKHKGGAGPAAPFFRSWTGGWIENKAWYVPIVPTPPAGSPQTRRRFASEAQDVAAPGGLPTSALASEPFFQRFQATEDGTFYPGYQGSRLHAPIGDTNADDEARKLVTVAKCLGEAIPALSFPLGSNSSTKFDDLGGNFDLNGTAFKNGWPSSRPDTNWKHSDCLNVAYTFNFPLYDKMTNDGGLK